MTFVKSSAPLFNLKIYTFLGTSLSVQWLGLCLLMQTGCGGSTVSFPGWGAVIPHALWSKHQNRNSTVTSSVKTLKMIHIKEQILKEKSLYFFRILRKNFVYLELQRFLSYIFYYMPYIITFQIKIINNIWSPTCI